MKRIAVALTLVAMLFVIPASEVLGGAGQNQQPPPPTSGPAITATIVTDTTCGPSVAPGVCQNPTLGQTSIRLSKGSHFSGATFLHLTARDPWGEGWHRGCDSRHGVDAYIVENEGFDIGEDTVATLTDRRFLGQNLSNWIPPLVVTALFEGPNVDSPVTNDNPNGISGLGLGIDLDQAGSPLITDIDNPVCTEVNDGSPFLKYILSFTAVIQFQK